MNRFEKAQHDAAVGFVLERIYRGYDLPEVGADVLLDYEDGTEGPGSWTRAPVEITEAAIA